MKLEVGKRYVMRNGNKTGPLKQDGITFYGRDTTENAMRTWGQHGEWYYHHDRTEEDADAYDIVSEYVEPQPQHPLRWVENCKPDKPGIWLAKNPDDGLYALVLDQQKIGAALQRWTFTHVCYLGPIPEILPPKKKVVERLWLEPIKRTAQNAMEFEEAWFVDGETIQPPGDWIRTDRTREREI